ncbi:phage protein [Anaerosolibacter sp.]|uniref:phage protein n=1 Tax=Anaerosolibacter sp. TaxID=1872527 RepID=UPI0039F1281A
MLFSRDCKLTIGQPGRDGKEITGLRIVFDIEKDLTNESNKGQMSIYNLSRNTLNVVERADTIILLDAGYKGNIGRIFQGAITFVTSKGDTDIETQIEAADGLLELRDSIFSKGYKSGIRSDVILYDISISMGSALQIAPGVVHKQYLNGFAFAGNSREALKKVCSYIGASWSIQNDILQITPAGGTTSSQAFLISGNTGMIGKPERIVKSQTKGKGGSGKSNEKEKKVGWRIRRLIEPSIIPGSLVKIDSKQVAGFFRVESLKHSGDTHGDDWYTEMEVFELG